MTSGGNRHRIILTRMRGELLAPVEAVVHTGQLLLETAEEPGLDVEPHIRNDLKTICTASRDLYNFVREQLESEDFSSAAGDAELDRQMQIIRHDIRNRLNHVQGLCQLLLMEEFDPNTDEQNQFFGSFTHDLKDIRSYVDSCLQLLDEFAAGTALVEPYTAVGSLDETAIIETVELPTGLLSHAHEPAFVLVVDDNQLNREMLARFLDKLGHRCDFAENGRQALQKIAENDYDLVLLDIIMPEMNGLQVLQNLNANGTLRHLPVLVVSGLDSTREVVRCIEFGADDFLPRPINMTLLRARVNASLEKKRLREREFAQFFPKEVARQVARRPEILDEGREADVTVLFCDIRGFSRISESLTPADTVRWIRDVMEVLSNCVIEHHGVLVDYIGDELVAMWGAPTPQQDHAQLATKAALAMLERLPEISDKWLPEFGLPTRVGIGLNSGKAHVGNTGTARRRKYGPLGNTVNLASRVQGATKYVQTNLLITGNTHAALGAEMLTRRLCTVKVTNIEEPVDLFEVIPVEKLGWKELTESYERALASFENRQFRIAAAMLGNMLLEHPTDGPSLLLMSRVVNELINGTEREFDPVWPLPGK